METSYKEKYERTLAKLRGLIDGIREEKCEIVEDDIIDIFPELAESEDEKVRKELIDAVQGLWDNDALPMPLSVKRKDKWIAWLENIPYTIDHEKREGFHLGYKACLERQAEQKIEENKGNIGGIFPNPEWSEDDETVLNNLIYALENDRIGNNRDEYVDWLKSIKQRIKKGE